MLVQSPVPRLSAAAGVVEHLGPRLGQHTDEVYTELLRLGDAEIAGLRSRGAI
jgi:crotonobetainyl-CoA:carnitine CoA-transferase CaiB-like acyl-CoA transferase